MKNNNYQKYNFQKRIETHTEKLSNADIKSLLKEYISVEYIVKVPVGIHVRYFINDPETKKKKFRYGGFINKIDPLGRYIMLSNGTTQPWSVQIPNTIFYKKISNEELKEEIKKEVLTEIKNDSVNNNDDLKKKYKALMKQMKELSNDNNDLKKKNEKLTKQLSKIQLEIEK